jgi:hypothetical protein
MTYGLGRSSGGQLTPELSAGAVLYSGLQFAYQEFTKASGADCRGPIQNRNGSGGPIVQLSFDLNKSRG